MLPLHHRPTGQAKCIPTRIARAIFVSKNHFPKTELAIGAENVPSVPEFEFKKGQDLRGNSYAYDFFYKGPDAPEMRELQGVPRDAWIPGESMMDSITEQSRPLTYYGSVLTVLWIRE